jgi:hypothetical protein
MMLRPYLQAIAYSTVVLGVPLATAADVDYTSAEQRLHDLELRLNSLETASYNEPSCKADCDACGSNCGDGCGGDCDSCGCGDGCGDGCCDSSNWLCPCKACIFNADLLFFQVNNGNLDPGAPNTQNTGDAAYRFTLGRLNDNGRSIRVRYFNYNHDLDPIGAATGQLNMETLDLEAGRRFTLGGNWRGEINGGLRWAQLQQLSDFGGGVTPALNYDSVGGPVVGLHLRGRKILRGESFINLRHAWLFGKGETAFGQGERQGTFTISELQFGLEWNRQVRFGTLVARTMLEAQSWDDGRHGNIGLIGGGFGLGLAR